MLEANYTQAGSFLNEHQHRNYVGNEKVLGAKPPEPGAILIALDHLEGEIKNLRCAIDALQEKTAPITYYPPKACGESGQEVKSGCLVYEKIEDRISELYQMRQRLNSIIEALQV